MGIHLKLLINLIKYSTAHVKGSIICLKNASSICVPSNFVLEKVNYLLYVRSTVHPTYKSSKSLYRKSHRIARLMTSTPICSSWFLVSTALRAGTHRSRATPPPGTIPSSTAARVAQRAS